MKTEDGKPINQVTLNNVDKTYYKVLALHNAKEKAKDLDLSALSGQQLENKATPGRGTDPSSGRNQ
jgi:hypothetical protein